MAAGHGQPLDHLDVWTSALLSKSSAGRGSNGKLEAYGIKKLRELILELAVRGKLVAQDPNDEPASVLLEKIAKEKARLIKAGKIKQEKPLADLDAMPHELPANWKWARLPSIASYMPGKTPSTKNPSYWSDNPADVPWVSISDMEHFGVLTETSKRVTTEAAENVFGYEPIPKGSLLMSFKLTVGKMAILGVDAYHNEAILSIQPYSGIARDYLFKVLPARAQAGNTKRAIMGDTLNATSLSLLLVPIPPLAEQHRIVAKVDELMALCDQLEQQQADSLAAHHTLVETLLGTLTRIESQHEFSAAWARIASHFDTLFTTEASIDQLKQTILQLAVMGKLVPQDPNDEPASVFIERIGKEKARLIDEGKIKKDKPLSESVNQVAFELPEGWRWVRFEDVVNITSGVTLGRKVSGKRLVTVPYLRVANVQRGDLDLYEVKDIDLTEDELDKYLVMARDLLITEGGDWDKVGRTAIWREELPLIAHQNHVFKARCLLEEQNEVWLERYLNCEIARGYFAGSSKQTTNLASINKTQLRGCPVAMPPLREQHRIVAKVDELMALCDALKARLADAQTTQLHLADAIVEQAVC